MRATERLEEFTRLRDLDRIHAQPVARKSARQPDLGECASLLKDVYTSERPGRESLGIGAASLQDLPRFSAREVQHIFSKMAKKKASDARGLLLEMFTFGGELVAEKIAHFLNDMLDNGVVPEHWFETHFAMLPKSGNLKDANNWRPIALLSITYKILAKILHERLRGKLEQQQAEDQFGFRSGRSTTHALFALEQIIAKSIEWNTPAWIICIDLRKAFDRVEQDGLFQALHEQGVEDGYVHLLKMIYAHQRGILGEEQSFNITRGVRQGDVLSPALFNATLEQAMRRWKQELSHHGLALVPDEQAERMTNIRYADDILLVGKSLDEAVEMLELLEAILREYGLELNMAKTMILSTCPAPGAKTFVEVCGAFAEILGKNGSHKYLGRAFSGNLQDRGKSALDHRLGCGWAKFQNLQGTLTCKHVPLKLRLKLFDAVVSPTVLYALSTAPLTAGQLHKLDVTQRCMLRRILGWVCYDHDTWQERGHRMKTRMARALELQPVQVWSEQLMKTKEKFVAAIGAAPLWTKLAYEWDPVACATLNGMSARRRRGRPRTRCI